MFLKAYRPWIVRAPHASIVGVWWVRLEDAKQRASHHRSRSKVRCCSQTLLHFDTRSVEDPVPVVWVEKAIYLRGGDTGEVGAKCGLGLLDNCLFLTYTQPPSPA
ncbi:hypothetical protein PMIN06_006815 [Paraphaeosphaeria minitans]